MNAEMNAEMVALDEFRHFRRKAQSCRRCARLAASHGRKYEADDLYELAGAATDAARAMIRVIRAIRLDEARRNRKVAVMPTLELSPEAEQWMARRAEEKLSPTVVTWRDCPRCAGTGQGGLTACHVVCNACSGTGRVSR